MMAEEARIFRNKAFSAWTKSSSQHCLFSRTVGPEGAWLLGIRHLPPPAHVWLCTSLGVAMWTKKEQGDVCGLTKVSCLSVR